MPFLTTSITSYIISLSKPASSPDRRALTRRTPEGTPMLDKLAAIEARYEELNRLMADPEVATNPDLEGEATGELVAERRLPGRDRSLGLRRRLTRDCRLGDWSAQR